MAGVKEVIDGALAVAITKSEMLVAVPIELDTLIFPVVAFEGTVTVIADFVAFRTAADAPLKVTALFEGTSSNPLP